MCRFLLVKSKKIIAPQKLLAQFSKMAKKSRALDGDWQGDGWGISYKIQKWEVYKSLKPIWEDEDSFAKIPKTSLFLVHARSASFEKDRGVIEFNQPFIYKNYAFVFNGLLKGVRLRQKVSGRIGVQKIWSLLRVNLHLGAGKALAKTCDLIVKNTKEVAALNIGLCDGRNFFVYSQFVGHPEYYQLLRYKSPDLEIIVSEKIGHYNFSSLPAKSIA